MSPTDDTTQAPVEPTAPAVDPAVAPVDAPTEPTPAPEAPVAAEVETPVEEASVPPTYATETSAKPESPAEAASEPEEELSTPEAPSEPVSTESAPPAGDAEGNSVEEEVSRVEALEEQVLEDEQKASHDLTREEEVQASTDPRIDGSGILTQTVDDFNANLPKNDQGQVEIDEDGKIVGLDDASQPNQSSVSAE